MKSLLKKIVRPSIRKKLILSFVCILIIPALVIGGFSFSAAKKEVENEMLTSAKTNAEVLNSIIDDTLNSTLKDTTYFANEITQKLINGEESPDIRKTFAQYNVLHPNLVSIYIGSVNGLMIQEPKKDLPDDYDPRQRPWYQEALKKKGEVIITDPYVAASSGDMVVTLAMQLSDGSGVVGIDLNLRTLSELANRTKIGNEGYTFLLDKNKKYIVHPTEKVGSAATQKFYDNLYKKSSGEFSYVFKGAHKKMIFTTNSLTGWKIGGTMYSSEVDDAARSIYISMIIIIVASIIIGGVVVYFIIRSITNPLKKLRNSAKKISSGDLTEKIEVRTNDEIGELSNTFNEMSENLRQLIQQVDLGAEQVAASSEQLTASAEQTVGATEQVASANQAISNGVVTTTKGLENHATAMEEIAQGMERVTDSAALVTDLTHQTTKDAKAGGESVQQSVQQMQSINVSVKESNTIIKSLHERSREIGSITDVISGISDQTNLLALNAAIEAARAGEHGKGFAVVADEIRKLAEQSSLSTKKITELIQGIQIDTENSVKVMEKASEDVESGLVLSEDMSNKFANILQGVTNIGPQMEDVAAISQQISASVQEVTSTAAELTKIARTNAEQTNEMSATTEEQVASMEEIAASAKSLSQLAEDLQELIKKFKI